MKKYRFRRWLRNWLSNFDVEAPYQIKAASTVSQNIGDHRNSLNFQMHSASGGYVLESHSYDKKTDEHNRYLHIITDQQDLGEAIAKIVTIEMLRR